MTEESWKKFQECLQLAEQDLTKAYEINPNNAEPFYHLITVAAGLSYGLEAIEHYYQQTIERAPFHYPARKSKMNFIQPRWFGSWEAMEMFEKECERDSKSFPMILIVNRFSVKQMSDRSTKHQQSWYKSQDKWLKTALKQLEQSPTDINLMVMVTYMAYMAKENKIAYKYFEQVGDKYLLESRYTSLKNYSTTRAKVCSSLASNNDIYDTEEEGKYLIKAVTYAPDDISHLNRYVSYLRRMHDKNPSDIALKEKYDAYFRINKNKMAMQENTDEIDAVQSRKIGEQLELKSYPQEYETITESLLKRAGRAQEIRIEVDARGSDSTFDSTKIFDDIRTVIFENKDYSKAGKRINTLLTNANTALDHYYLTEYIEYIAYPTANEKLEHIQDCLDEWVEKDKNSHIPYLLRGFYYLN